MENTIATLKKLIRETAAPYFSDDELTFYMEKNGNDVMAAAYECLIVKAEDTTLQVGSLSLPDTSKYFLRLARTYRPSNSGTLIGG